MALQVIYTNEATGELVPAAYCRIVEVVFRPREDRAMIRLNYYVDMVAGAAGKAPFFGVDIGTIDGEFAGHFAPAALVGYGGDTRAAGYRFLKSRPEFASALDV